MLEHLPRSSHFRQAAADDDEWAEDVLAREDVAQVGPPASVPLVEYTREVELLTGISELLQALNANVRALAGDRNPPRVQKLPRPRTAIDRARDRARAARVDALIGEVESAMQRWAERHPAHTITDDQDGRTSG